MGFKNVTEVLEQQQVNVGEKKCIMDMYKETKAINQYVQSSGF